MSSVTRFFFTSLGFAPLSQWPRDLFYRACILLIVVTGHVHPVRAEVSSPGIRNVLFIVSDDLKASVLGCYGDQVCETPNIDRLARRGVLFERAYCQYAKCGTSRLSLMTGLRPDSIGVFSNRDRDVVAFRNRRPDALSMSRWLMEHGYHTRSFGKVDHDGWHVDAD